MRQITSNDNARFRALLKLHHSSRERRKAGLSLLDGVHLVAAYLEHIGAPCDLVLSHSSAHDPEIAAIVQSNNAPEPIMLSDSLFRELSSVSTPTGILAVVKTPQPALQPRRPGPCILLEDIQDPGNLGSILRSAAAAGIKEVYISRASAQAWSPRVLRAGMGAHFALDIFENVDVVTFAMGYPGRVIATAKHGALSLYAADLRGQVALVFGNEGAGATPEIQAIAHAVISIPMPGKSESLNVAAAAAVCLFERVRQLARQ